LTQTALDKAQYSSFSTFRWSRSRVGLSL